MENRFKGVSKGFESRMVATKEKMEKEVKLDPFQIMKPILEGIVEGCEDKSREQLVSEFYIGASQLWGDLDYWPERVRSFYGRINYKNENPESLVCIESREKMVRNVIKNKLLSLTGVSFKGRSQGFSKLKDRFTRFDGSRIDTRLRPELDARGRKIIDKNGKVKMETIKAMSRRDYQIKGIETGGIAKHYKIKKDKDGNERKVLVRII